MTVIDIAAGAARTGGAPVKNGIIDLFAGGGGIEHGLGMLGRHDAVGVEWWAPACEVARAAGQRRIGPGPDGDVSKLSPSGLASTVAWTGEGLTGAPPCGPFSAAGKGLGNADAHLVLAAVEQIGAGRHPRGALARLRHHCRDDRTPLVLEPLRWALELRPGWIILEQVPKVLPLWRAVGQVLGGVGYSTWTGVVKAERYGVPQTRRRAVLLARLGGPVAEPPATHSAYHERSPERLDPGVPRWVSMAEALGWGGGEPVAHWDRFMRSNYGTSGDPAARGRINRNMWVLQGGPQEKSTARPSTSPAGTIHSQRAGNLTWRFAGAGATSHVTAGQVPGELGQPSHRITGKGTAAWVEGGRHACRVTVAEAAVLQSFPADYPFEATRRKGDQYLIIGNSVPPLLAAHLGQAVGAGSLPADVEVAS